MRINSNITAYYTNNALLQNETMFSNSTKKLSSGFKINTAGDDPTGYAISGRMRAQIKALDKSEVNATSGKSILDSADSALAEVTEMLQRINELAVKGANGTLSDDDRNSLHLEADQLRSEISRISKTAELNDQNILDGSMENTGYCETDPELSVDGYNGKTPAGTYDKVKIEESTDLGSGKLTVTVEGFPEGAEPCTMTFDFPQYYDDSRIDPNNNNLPTAVTTGLYVDGANKGSVKICADGSQLITVNGTKGESLTLRVSPKYGAAAGSKNYEKDTKSITDADGNSKEYSIYKYDFSSSAEETITLTGKGDLILQVGANEEQKIYCHIPEISAERLDIDDLDLSTIAGSQNAIDKIKNALSYVNSARSQIGAYTNRVEQTISYLQASSENLETSLSRIQDTDMAKEMTNYASLQVLTQAATSMLAQANQAPQQALQLLQ